MTVSFFYVVGEGEGGLFLVGGAGLALGFGLGGAGGGKVAARLGICCAVRNAENGKKLLN